MMAATSHLAHANHYLHQYICVKCVCMCYSVFIALILQYVIIIFIHFYVLVVVRCYRKNNFIKLYFTYCPWLEQIRQERVKQ